MNQYTFRILYPQKAHSPEDIRLLDQLYVVWRETFNNELKDKNITVDPDDFFRQQVLFALYEGDSVIGMNLATEFDFNIRHHLDHHFVRGLSEEAVETMKSKNVQSVLSLEYSTITPEWRRRKTDIPWAEVLVSMALLYNDYYKIADAVIGTPRNDKMIGVATNAGYEIVSDKIVKVGHPCSVVMSTVRKRRAFPNLLTHKAVHTLWENRIDSSTKENKNIQIAKAA